MKFLITTLVAALIVGRGTTKDQRCSKYEGVYNIYLASIKVRPISKEESAAAATAAIFLRTYCGWVGTRGVDTNGVPIIHHPGGAK